MNVKVSIIIPVYNVESYLEQCLQSVVDQSLKEIEIICIDDGSTDKSPQILKQFQQKDKRIKVERIENSGQGTARNLGMKIATGEFIGFVDSDDFIDAQMFEKLYTSAIKHQTEVAYCFSHCFDNATGKPVKIPFYEWEKEKLGGNEIEMVLNEEDVANFLPYITIVPWNKIYRRDWLKENKIYFGEGHIFEDVYFSFHVLVKAKRIILLRQPLYHYRANRKFSTMNSISAKNCHDVFVSLNATEMAVSGQPRNVKLMEGFRVFKLRQLLTSLNGVYHDIDMDLESKNEFFDLVRENMGNKDFFLSEFDLMEKIQLALVKNNFKFLFHLKVKLDIYKMKLLGR